MFFVHSDGAGEVKALYIHDGALERSRHGVYQDPCSCKVFGG